MTDVQVSNARRIGFTALALVSFWVIATRVYWFSCDSWLAPVPPPTPTTNGVLIMPMSASLALLPSILLCLSSWNRPVRLRDPWWLASSLLFAIAIGFSFWLGEVDADANVRVRFDETTDENLSLTHFNRILAQARLEHTVSWLWLLAIILTSAFVIYGAWRRVRPADVETVDEEVMTDVQVSNARRITFTALAIVTLWAASFETYSLGIHMAEYLYIWFGPEIANRVMAYPWFYRVLVCGLLMALMPFAFLFVSRHNSPVKLRDHRILIGGLLFATCIGYWYWVGEQDAWDAFAPPPTRWWLRDSWLWFLLPLILITGFVIFDAWRRAAQDAAVAVVEEDA